jgi:hypothetical protein
MKFSGFSEVLVRIFLESRRNKQDIQDSFTWDF